MTTDEINTGSQQMATDMMDQLRIAITLMAAAGIKHEDMMSIITCAYMTAFSSHIARSVQPEAIDEVLTKCFEEIRAQVRNYVLQLEVFRKGPIQ